MNNSKNMTGPEADSVKCLCQKMIPLKDIISHAKLCYNFKAIFGTLPEAIDNSIKSAKDAESLTVLWNFFAYAKNNCKEKIRSFSKQTKAVHIISQPPPIPDSSSSSKKPSPPVISQPSVPSEKIEKEEEKELKSKCGSSDTLVCAVCNNTFGDFTEIWYLQACLHSVCKNDLKRIIKDNYPKEARVFCPVKDCATPLMSEEILVISFLIQIS